MVLKSTPLDPIQSIQTGRGPSNVPAATVAALGQKPNWFDGDFANAKRLVPALIASGKLTDPAVQTQLAELFGQLANQRKADSRSIELVNETRRALVGVVNNPNSTPAEKTAARDTFEMVRTSAEGWQSNPKGAPGYDKTLDLPTNWLLR